MVIRLFLILTVYVYAPSFALTLSLSELGKVVASSHGTVWDSQMLTADWR